MSMAGAAERATLAVCGSGGELSPEVEALAEDVGREVIRAGMNLVTGGMGGVMEAACRGAAHARDIGEGAGAILGLLPGETRAQGNPYCDFSVPTGLGIGRNLLVVRAADGVILVHGGSGTLSEAAFAWQLGKPIVALSVSGGWAGRLGGERLDGRRSDAVFAARTPAEAVALLRDELSGLR